MSQPSPDTTKWIPKHKFTSNKRKRDIKYMYRTFNIAKGISTLEVPASMLFALRSLK